MRRHRYSSEQPYHPKPCLSVPLHLPSPSALVPSVALPRALPPPPTQAQGHQLTMPQIMFPPGTLPNTQSPPLVLLGQSVGWEVFD
ncbi:hypothetical protein BCR35DRAFT_32484 [Leucosporidium creatinivorum]|uniref:Uncharacterized protein n=1 Tax=Leucosporidium creatinivorum TaxID=106004 RepID=A0A1Y2FVT0_9BASI|nr:hypothetical protein BCR35DRAFT_32484 [Leucosporidium creatinivorum]